VKHETMDTRGDRRQVLSTLLGGAGLAAIAACAERSDSPPLAAMEQTATGAGGLWFDNVAELKAVNGTMQYQTAVIDGYATAGDGGGGAFWWDTSATTGDNAGTILVPTSPTGRWRRIYEGALNIKWFGAQPGGADCSGAIQQALAVANAAGGGSVYVPPGFFSITASANLPMVVSSHTTVFGDGPASVISVANAGPNYLALFASANDGTAPVSNVRFQNLRVDQNSTGNSQCVPTGSIHSNPPTGYHFIVLLFFNADKLSVEGCHFDTCFGTQTVDLAGRSLRVVDCVFRRVPVGSNYLANSSV